MTHSNLPIVRPAVPEDRPEIWQMCRELHAENGIFGFDEDCVNAMLDKHYQRTGGIIGVIGSTGRLEASCCLVFADIWHSKSDTHIEEIWNYVKPAYRKSHNVDALMEFSKAASLKIGVPLMAGVITNKHTAAKVRLYQRHYGTPAGAFFVYNAQWQNEHEPSVEDFNSLFYVKGKRGNGWHPNLTPATHTAGTA